MAIPPACAAASSASTPALLCIDEVGYLTYDSHAADLLFQVVNHRYERNSIFLTTHKGFKDWNTVFPNATSLAGVFGRHSYLHVPRERLTAALAEASRVLRPGGLLMVTLIEGTSYRVRESELEAAARKKLNSEGKPPAH